MEEFNTTCDLKDRLEKNRLITSDGHWLWLGCISKQGYGLIQTTERLEKVHRLAYRIYKEDIGKAWRGGAENLVLHNPPCIIRHCFNPEHLYLGNNKQNAKDCIDAKRHRNSRKTYCAKGHPYNEENTYWRKGKYGRKCKMCMSINSLNRKFKRIEK